MIINEKVNIKITKQNIKHYKSLNIKCKLKDIITVDTLHLQKNSNIKVKVLCDVCGKESLLSFKNYNKNFEKYNIYTCLKCSHIKNEKTLLIKHGVKHQMCLESTKDKIKKTSLKKYKVDNPSKNLEIIEKTKQSCISKYGYNNVFEVPYIKEKIQNRVIRHYKKRENFDKIYLLKFEEMSKKLEKLEKGGKL